MAADGSVIIDTRMDTTGVQNGVSAIKQSFNGLGSAVKKIGLLIGGAFAVGKLVQFGKECVELGSDLAEVQNVVDVTFTTMSDKVNEFAKNAMTSAGLSETMAKRYVGTFGAMSKSFGFSEAQAYDMSTALTQLTGDVASFYNISQDLAYIKLKSVFTGISAHSLTKRLTGHVPKKGGINEISTHSLTKRLTGSHKRHH